ncbi:hypothetical protein ACOSQ4_022097 [Xanthoceras sorbifolium]
MQAATKVCHVVAMPYPARGHINPLLILSKLLASKKDDILITFVLTEEWHRTIASEVFPPNIRFATISNDVIPSAQLQAADVVAFFRTVKLMAAPFEQILDRLDPPVTTIITDILLPFVIEAGYSRNIPVALFWAPSTTTFTILYHAHLFDKGIPVNMLEPQVCDVFKAKLEYPVYSVGPLIPYYELDCKSSTNGNDQEPHYIEWLNSQPTSSVLYISMGSLFSISSAQIDEMVAGLKISGVRFLWVARDDTYRLQEDCRDLGLVVPWCHQLKVLSHSSVGGFLTHCGVPLLTFPLFGDQITQGKQAVEDLKREKEVHEICQAAVKEGGSSDTDLDAFIQNISQG